MSIVRFDPFRGLEPITRRMNRFLDEFNESKELSLDRGNFVPRVDIKEDEKTLKVSAEIPGMKKEDIKVTVNDENILTIKGEKKSEEKKEDESAYRVERRYGSFTRSFMLPENVDSESINAKVDDGVLNITLDKKEPEKPKEREIEIG